MSMATSAIIGTAIGVGGSIAGGAISSRGAGRAARTQAEAAVEAALIDERARKEALAFERERLAEEKRQFGVNQENIAPWLTAGSGAVTRLAQLLRPGGTTALGTTTPGGALATPWGGKFTAPTVKQAISDPGYQFRMDEGKRALEASAAARGGLLTTGNLRQLERFGQDYASNEYDKTYGRRFGEYLQGYNEFQQGQSNTFNRLAALAGVGQTAAGEIARLPVPGADSRIPGIMIGGGQQQGNALQDAAAARASGYVTSADALGSGIKSGFSYLSDILRSKRKPGWVDPAGDDPRYWYI